MSRSLRWLALTLCLAAIPVRAQTVSSEPGDPDSKDPRAMTLSLDDAITKTAENNLGVQFDRYQYEMAGWSAQSEWGAFDWFTNADIRTSSNEQPVSSQIQSSQSKQTIANFGVTQLIPTGATYSVGFNNSRSSNNDRFTTVNPSYRSSFGLDLTQPLLRNFGSDVTMRNVRIARNTLGVSEEGFRNSLTQATLGAEQAYWDLVYARQNLEVVKAGLALATDQQRITKIRIDVGASAPLDILQPRVAVATREEDVILAQAAVRSAEDRLRQQMNLDPAEWDRPILPTDSISYQPVEVNLDQAVSQALERRPEVRQAKLGTNTNEIVYKFARNQVLPRLDLNVQYGGAGLGGKFFDADPVTGEPIIVDNRSFGSAVNQAFGFGFPSWTVGVSVGIPVTNVGARAERKRAELDVKQARIDEDRIRQEIVVDVRQAARNIDTAAKQIAATKAAREAAEQNLDAERKRFENGMTTNFQVLQIQQDLSDARSREIQALVLYRKFVADYHRAAGDLLEAHDIAVNPPPDMPAGATRLERLPWMRSAK